MKIISTPRRMKLFWQLAKQWFTQQFDAVASSIDFTEVEEKIDDVKDDVADVKTAVENIDFSELAKQGTNSNATNTAILAKFDDITIDTSTLAKDATVAKEAQATLNKEAIIAEVNNAKPDLSTVAKQGTDSTVTLTGVDGKVSALPTAAQIQSGLAKEVQVKDGNDTAISVGKEVRSEVGTGSDTAAETGTLFAVVKWIKDKVKSIYNAITALATLIGTPASGQQSTLFAAIAAGGGGGGGGGDAQESTSQAILAAVKNNDTTALAELLNSTHGLTAIQSLLNGIVNTYPYAKETNATQNKADVISAVNGAMEVNFLANGIQAMADAELVVVPDGGQAESVTMDANKLYVFQNRVSDLTISFGTPTAGIVNEYHMLLTIGATIPTITMPNAVVWSYGVNPLSGLTSGRTFEIGILYNSGSVYFAIYDVF